jgi:hypothetical protein
MSSTRTYYYLDDELFLLGFSYIHSLISIPTVDIFGVFDRDADKWDRKEVDD